jgi:hypothetical protein
MVVAENREPHFGIMLWRTTKVAWRGGFGKTGSQSARPFCRFFPVFSQAFGELPPPMVNAGAALRSLAARFGRKLAAIRRFALNLEAAA